MRSTGIVRKIDGLGRIVLPKEIRHQFNIAQESPLEFFVDGNHIILKKYNPGCMECEAIGVELFGHKVKVCRECMDKMIR